MAATLPSSSSPQSSSLAVGVASIAVALAAFALWRGGGTERAPVVGEGTLDLRPSIESIEQRVTALERRPAPVVSAPVPGLTDAARTPVHDERIDALVLRLEQAEATLARLAAQRPSSAEVPASSPAEDLERRRVAQQQLMVTSRDAILDPRATEQQKREAWGRLRSAGADAWTDAVVDEMVRVGLTSTDPNVRADVWRQADGGSRSERIVPALMQALASDADANVREEAAETLENYAKLPHVRLALEAAANGDVEEKVRNFARRSLERASR